MSSIALHGSVDPFIVVLSALLVDIVLAGVVGIRGISDGVSGTLRAAAAWCETRLNRPQRSARSRTVRGGLVVLVFTIGGVVAAAGGMFAVRVVPEGWLLEAVLVALLLRQRRTFDKVRAIGGLLEDGRGDVARAGLARLVFYDTTGLDSHGVARGSVQFSAQQVCDGMVAPVFWYLLLGLPGLCVYRSINSLAEVVGHPSPRLAGFGRTADLVNRIFNVVPAGIGGVIVAIAAIFVPTANPLRALRTTVRDEAHGSGPPVGWTLRAFAGALGLALGGPVRYDGDTISFPWIGDGRARVTAQDVTRATYLFAVSGLIAMVTVALLRLVSTAV